MGYHVHITREKNGISSEIPLEDWLRHVEDSPELEFERTEGDDVASKFTRSIHAARWNGAANTDAWLGWSSGEIWTKNPSEELIDYMIEIAPKFGARVRGDEGEYYRTLEDVYYEEEGREVPWQERSQKQVAAVAFHRKKQLVWNCIRIILLLLTAYLFAQYQFR